MDREHRTLDARLQETYRVEPPDSLHARLLAICDDDSARDADAHTRPSWLTAVSEWLAGFRWSLAVPAMAAAAAVAILWSAGTRVTGDAPPGIGDDAVLTAQQQAVRDFVVVMAYLQASTVRVNREVNTELGAGLMTAFERGEQSFKDSSNRVTNGG